MNKITNILLIFIITFVACNNSNKENNSNEDTTINEQDTTEEVTNNDIENNEIDYYKNISGVYEGKIDGKYEIVMFLENNEEWGINGKYFYKGVDTELIIDGGINSEGVISLSEYNPKGIKTGDFVGKLTNNIFEGEWELNDKKLPFELIKTDQEYEDYKPYALSNMIDSEDFKKFVRKFPEIQLPITIDINEHSSVFIITDEVRKYIDDSYEINTLGAIGYCFGFSFYTEEYIALFIIYRYMPGVNGIDRIDYELCTYNYYGKKIDSNFIGGSGYDTNMGVNEILSDNSIVTIDKNYNIKIVTTNNCDQLIETDDPDMQIESTSKTDSTFYKILKTGIIE